MAATPSTAHVGLSTYTRSMTPKAADYIAAGKALDADEREIAAVALQQVDEAEQAEIDAAWDEAIDRRLDEPGERQGQACQWPGDDRNRAGAVGRAAQVTLD